MDLFDNGKNDRSLIIENSNGIKGLKIYFDFITKAEEDDLLLNIDKSNWLNDLTRRVQHYGYKYNYLARRIDKSYYIGEIPNWMNFLLKRLIENEIINFLPDQAIVNEYIDNQGIAAHIDCEPCFGDTIISISLKNTCIMEFQRKLKPNNKVPILLLPRSLIVMTGESRFEWCHGIPSRKKDYFNNQIYNRGRRVSITFRKVVLDT